MNKLKTWSIVTGTWYLSHWHLGQRIFEEEQQGKDRADYGTYLTRNIAKSLEPEYGSGFGVRQLEQARQFYRTYPNANTLRSEKWGRFCLIQKSGVGSA